MIGIATVTQDNLYSDGACHGIGAQLAKLAKEFQHFTTMIKRQCLAESVVNAQSTDCFCAGRWLIYTTTAQRLVEQRTQRTSSDTLGFAKASLNSCCLGASPKQPGLEKQRMFGKLHYNGETTHTLLTDSPTIASVGAATDNQDMMRSVVRHRHALQCR